MVVLTSEERNICIEAMSDELYELSETIRGLIGDDVVKYRIMTGPGSTFNKLNKALNRLTNDDILVAIAYEEATWD